jgi:hypothetical protein
MFRPLEELIEDIIVESSSPYWGKLLPEEEKFAEIQAYIEEVRAGDLQA